jgi:hypothetical protein
MDNSIINETFQLFSELMNERFAKGIFTTEDSVRYTFFHSLGKCGNLSPSDIILERQHPSIPRAEIDMYVPSKNGTPELFFEFKFDRAIPSEKNAPRPYKAGKIFADIMRLACLKSDFNTQCYLVYVTDAEMASYFGNYNNQLDDFFNLGLGEKMAIDKKYVAAHCKTFAKAVGNKVIPSEVRCRRSEKIVQNIWLRIYEIQPQS